MERMEEKNDSDKCGDDLMLPGFRFHPTDEELVEFYLKRKLQHRPLPIELIKQVDIYKYDPWDLPKLASTGEKEWYFYCPRDRKYRNSTRPNRVTGSGFWKATGTDRPIYSSDGGKCIGLKKSLVFYRGRAAKGIKTDWMMHEFRLPSTTTDGGGGGPPHPPPKKIFDKTLPLTDSWAICRIFKKTNSTANRGISISHNWTPSLSTTTSSDAFTYTPFTSESDHFQTLSALNIPSYTTKPSSTGKTSTLTSANEDYFFPGNLVFSEASNKTTTVDLTSPMFLHGEASKNSDSLDFDATQQQQQQQQHHYNLVMQESINGEDEGVGLRKNANIHHLWENIRFPFSLPAGQEPWKANLPWDSPPCPSEMSSTTYSTNKSYI